MSIKVGQHTFEGPFKSTDSLKGVQGIYAILGRNYSTDTWTVIDIGETENLQDRITNHDRKDCWVGRGYKEITVAVLYTPGWTKAQRVALEQKLRDTYKPACGVK